MKKNNYMNTKEINKIVKSIITLVIAFVVLLMLPFLSGIIALPFLFINQPIAYWISRFIQNLYGPVIVIVLLNPFPFVYPIIITFFKKNININKTGIKNIVIVAAMLVIGVSMTFQSFQNIWNLILDMEIIITSDYEEAKGELEFYDILIGDELCTRIKINNIKFDGGNVQEETLIEGNNYHVTYLPHTKYVVDYKSIP